MKLCFAAFSVVVAVAFSTEVSAQGIIQRLDDLNKAAGAALQRGDYCAFADRYSDVERMSRKASPEELDTLSRMLGVDISVFPDANFYYNYACALARAGRKRKALDAYEEFVDRAVGRMEVNYDHVAVNDPDLDDIRSDKRFAAAAGRLGGWCDYRRILREASPYAAEECDTLPEWRYAAPNDRNLVRVREYFKLDSIAGAGDELSKIRNILRWVHDNIPHDGSSAWPEERNAIAMYELCKREGRGINCRMLAMALNECYLSMGLKSRYVTCLPRTMVSDCHVINAVYSNQLDKWLWVDPTFNAYLLDENGTMMSIDEVRECIRQGRKCRLNDDANWNNRSAQTYDHYIGHYMAKNLYYLQCRSVSEWEAEGKNLRSSIYITLVPDATADVNGYATTDAGRFWQSPYTDAR